MYYYDEEGFRLYYGDAGAYEYIMNTFTELLIEGK